MQVTSKPRGVRLRWALGSEGDGRDFSTEVYMKRSSTFLLAGLTALGLAACNPPKNDTNTTGGTGSESGSMSTPADTSTTGAGTGAMTTDTTHMDTAKTK